MGDRPSMGWDAIPQGRDQNPAMDNAAGRIVSREYFDTIGIRILEGRDFDANDVRSRPLVMAINETLARQYFKDGQAVGGRLRVGSMKNPWAVVVGIPLALATAFLYVRIAGAEVRAQPHFRAAVALYALAAVLELLSEPLYNLCVRSVPRHARR